MKVYRSIEDLPRISNAIVTQGTFDGVHKAHQVILDRLKEIAAETGSETLLITFDPHPRMVLYPDDHGLKLLSTLDEKAELLEKAGIDHLLVIPFTREFSRLSSMQFIRDVLVNQIGLKALVIGYNHRFGKNREGAFDQLKEFSRVYGFEVVEIPEQDVDEISVSSTGIRNALLQGDMQGASKRLGRYYSIRGKVVEGKKLGRALGYPTANIIQDDGNKLIPADGIYAVKVIHNSKQYGGMLSIGENPTVPGKGRSIEVNIFDFSENIYGQTLQIDFVQRMRGEVKFDGLEALKAQLAKDKTEALRILNG